MSKYLGERTGSFCPNCPIGQKLGESRAGVYGAEVLPWGEVDILAVVNPANGNIFRTEVAGGSVTQENLQEAIDDCEHPATIQRRILPNKVVCGALNALLEQREVRAA